VVSCLVVGSDDTCLSRICGGKNSTVTHFSPSTVVFSCQYHANESQNSSVSIAISRWKRDYKCHPVQAQGNPASYKMGTRYFLGVKCLKHGADHPPLSSAQLQMGWSYNSASSCACIGMSWGDLYLYNHSNTPYSLTHNQHHKILTTGSVLE
jgi:hypothetical protein